jgi:drug/metabolite transporter (DMT)-like permease
MVWLGLTLAIVMDTFVQLCWKVAVERIPDTIGLWESLYHIIPDPIFQVALLLFILQFFNWMMVLARADLSYVQPVTALSYITVSGASMILFHERISLLRVAGLAMILLGVWFISRTDHRTGHGFRTRGDEPVRTEALP